MGMPMGGMQFHFGHPQPAVARQEDIDANTQSDVYRGNHSQGKGNEDSSSSSNIGKEEASDSEQKEEVKKDSCSICLEEFKDGDQIRRLPCFHIFHKHEIDRWLKTGNDKCPICRVPIDGVQECECRDKSLCFLGFWSVFIMINDC